MTITWADIGRVLLEGTILVAFLQFVAGPLLLEKFKASLGGDLEELRQELGLARETFGQYLALMLEYYGGIYQHYRTCQQAANWDRVVHPERESTNTKEEYLDLVDEFKKNWDIDEGKIRLLLPEKLLQSHETVLSALNDFTDAVKQYSEDDDSSKRRVEDAFHPVHCAVRAHEVGLREYLRTERLLK